MTYFSNINRIDRFGKEYVVCDVFLFIVTLSRAASDWKSLNHEISREKNAGLTNYPREKLSDLRNTYEKKFWAHETLMRKNSRPTKYTREKNLNLWKSQKTPDETRLMKCNTLKTMLVSWNLTFGINFWWQNLILRSKLYRYDEKTFFQIFRFPTLPTFFRAWCLLFACIIINLGQSIYSCYSCSWTLTKFPINTFKSLLTLVIGVFHNGAFSYQK